MLPLLLGRLVVGLFSCDYQHVNNTYITDSLGNNLDVEWKPLSCTMPFGTIETNELDEVTVAWKNDYTNGHRRVRREFGSNLNGFDVSLGFTWLEPTTDGGSIRRTSDIDTNSYVFTGATDYTIHAKGHRPTKISAGTAQVCTLGSGPPIRFKTGSLQLQTVSVYVRMTSDRHPDVTYAASVSSGEALLEYQSQKDTITPDSLKNYCSANGGVCSSSDSTSCTAANVGGSQPCDDESGDFVWHTEGALTRQGSRVCKHGYGYPLPTEGQFTLEYEWAYLNANEGLQPPTIEPKCTLMCHCETCDLHRVYSPNATLAALEIEPAFTDYYFESVHLDLDGANTRIYNRWTSPTAEAAWTNGKYQHWGDKQPLYTGAYLRSLLLTKETKVAISVPLGRPEIDSFLVVCKTCKSPTELPENNCNGPTHKKHEGEDFHVFLSCAKHATEKDCDEDIYTTWDNEVVNHTSDPTKPKRCQWVPDPFSVIKATENIPMDRLAYQGDSLGDKSPLHFQVTLDVGDNKEPVKLHTDQLCNHKQWLGTEDTAADCMFKILRTDNCSHDFFNYASGSGGDHNCGCALNQTDCSGGDLSLDPKVDVYSIAFMATKIAEQNNGQCKAANQSLPHGPHLVPFTAITLEARLYPNPKLLNNGVRLVSGSAIPIHSKITLTDITTPTSTAAYDYTVEGADIDKAEYYLEAVDGSKEFTVDSPSKWLTVRIDFADNAKAVYDCKTPNLPLYMQMNLQGYPANSTQGVIACVQDPDLFQVRDAFQWIHMHEEIKETPLTRNIHVVANNVITEVNVSDSSVLRSVNVATHACPRSLREVVILSSTTKDTTTNNKVGLFRACVPVTCYNSTTDEGKSEDDLAYICQATPRCEARTVTPYAKGNSIYYGADNDVQIGLCTPDFYKTEIATDVMDLTQSDWKCPDGTAANVSKATNNATGFNTIYFKCDVFVYYFRQTDATLWDYWYLTTPPAAGALRTGTAELKPLSPDPDVTDYYDLTRGTWSMHGNARTFEYSVDGDGIAMFKETTLNKYWVASANNHWKVYNTLHTAANTNAAPDQVFYTDVATNSITLQEYNAGNQPDVIVSSHAMTVVSDLKKLVFYAATVWKGFVSSTSLTSSTKHMDECHSFETNPLQNNKDDRRHLAPFPDGQNGLFFRSVDERYILGYNATVEPAYYNLAMCISFGEVDCKSRLASDISQERFPCPKSNTEYQSLKCEDVDTEPKCHQWANFAPLDTYVDSNNLGLHGLSGNIPPFITECTSFCGSDCGGKEAFYCSDTSADVACQDAATCASCSGYNVELLDPTKDCPAQSTLPSTVTSSTVTTTITTTTLKVVNECNSGSNCSLCTTCTNSTMCASGACGLYVDALDACGANASHKEANVCVVSTTTSTTTTASSTTITTTTTGTGTTTTVTPFIGDCCDTKNHRILQRAVESCSNVTEHVKHVAVGTCREGDWGGHAEWIVLPLAGPLVVIGVAWAVARSTGAGRQVRAWGSIAYTAAVIASVALQWHANNEDSRDVIVVVRVLLFAVAGTAMLLQGYLRNKSDAEPLLPELGIEGGTVFDSLLNVVFKYFHAATAWLAYGIAARMVYREIDTNKLLVEVAGDDVRVPMLLVAVGLGLQAVPIRTFRKMEGDATALKGANAGVMVLFLASSFYSFATILDHPVTSESFAAIIATVATWGFYSILVPTIDHEGQWFLKSELLLRIVATVLILVGGILLHREIDRTHIDYSAFQTYLETDPFLVAAFMLALVYSSFVIVMDVVILLFTAFGSGSQGDAPPKYTPIDNNFFYSKK